MTTTYIQRISLPQYELWAQMEGRRSPLSCTHEVTARCNNDCRHCYINLPASDAAARQAELTLDEICHIADQAVALGTLWWALTGGEPLLRGDFAEIYLALKRRGFLVSLFTNACLITADHVKLFKSLPPREIEVTVYGATEETYDRLTRRPGSYAAFRRGLDLLRQAGIPVRLKAMLLRSTMHEFPAIAEFCRTYGSEGFRYDPLLHLRYDRDPQRNAEIRAERMTAEEIIDIERNDPERLTAIEKKCDALAATPPPDAPYLFRCATGIYDYCLGYNGLFRLCSSLVHPECVYDLRAGTLVEAWEEFVPAVRARQSVSPEFLQRCHGCELAELCLWCPAHAYLEQGRLDSWCENFCDVAHARAAQATTPDNAGIPQSY